MFKKTFRTLVPVTVDDFDIRLKMVKGMMSFCFVDLFNAVLDLFLEMRAINVQHVHYYLAILLDPELNYLEINLMWLHHGSPIETRNIAKLYDVIFVVSLLPSICSLSSNNFVGGTNSDNTEN